MARKFLYFVAICITLVIAGRIVYELFQEELAEIALVPSAEFSPVKPLEGNAYEDSKLWYSRPGIGVKDPARWQPPLAEGAPALREGFSPLPLAAMACTVTRWAGAAGGGVGGPGGVLAGLRRRGDRGRHRLLTAVQLRVTGRCGLGRTGPAHELIGRPAEPLYERVELEDRRVDDVQPLLATGRRRVELLALGRVGGGKVGQGALGSHRRRLRAGLLCGKLPGGDGER
jgi:hypothetical protein